MSMGIHDLISRFFEDESPEKFMILLDVDRNLPLQRDE